MEDGMGGRLVGMCCTVTRLVMESGIDVFLQSSESEISPTSGSSGLDSETEDDFEDTDWSSNAMEMSGSCWDSEYELVSCVGDGMLICTVWP